MSGSAYTNLPPIDNLKEMSDYSDWIFSMKTYLEREGIWKCLGGDASAITYQQNMIKARTRLCGWIKLFTRKKCDYALRNLG